MNEYRIYQEKQLGELRADMHQIELRIEKKFNQSLITTISVLGSLILIASAASTFAHTIFHLG
jgi:trans-2-enoyl-CoA reductase